MVVIWAYRTLNHVRRQAFWPGWRGDVRRHCKQCQNCNGRFRGQLPRAGPLQPVLAAGQAAKSDIKLQRSKRAKPMTVNVDKLEPFVASEMPRSWLDDPRSDVLDVLAENAFIGGVGPISDEPETDEPETLAKQRLEPVLEDTESLGGAGMVAEAEADGGESDTMTTREAMAGVPPAQFRSPRPRREVRRPRRYQH